MSYVCFFLIFWAFCVFRICLIAFVLLRATSLTRGTNVKLRYTIILTYMILQANNNIASGEGALGPVRGGYVPRAELRHDPEDGNRHRPKNRRRVLNSKRQGQILSAGVCDFQDFPCHVLSFVIYQRMIFQDKALRVHGRLIFFLKVRHVLRSCVFLAACFFM